MSPEQLCTGMKRSGLLCHACLQSSTGYFPIKTCSWRESHSVIQQRGFELRGSHQQKLWAVISVRGGEEYRPHAFSLNSTDLQKREHCVATTLCFFRFKVNTFTLCDSLRQKILCIYLDYTWLPLECSAVQSKQAKHDWNNTWKVIKEPLFSSFKSNCCTLLKTFSKHDSQELRQCIKGSFFMQIKNENNVC